MCSACLLLLTSLCFLYFVLVYELISYIKIYFIFTIGVFIINVQNKWQILIYFMFTHMWMEIKGIFLERLSGCSQFLCKKLLE